MAIELTRKDILALTELAVAGDVQAKALCALLMQTMSEETLVVGMGLALDGKTKGNPDLTVALMRETYLELAKVEDMAGSVLFVVPDALVQESPAVAPAVQQTLSWWERWWGQARKVWRRRKPITHGA